MKTETSFLQNFYTNILEIKGKPGLYLNLKILKIFPTKKIIKILFWEQFSFLKIKSKISENWVFFFILQNFLRKIVLLRNNEKLFLCKKNFFLINDFKYKKNAQKRIYLSPIKFIQKNFPRILFYSYDFYCQPILHEKDFLWNNLVSDFFSQDMFNYGTPDTGHILIRLNILSDTLWILNEQYGKILKRGKHGCKSTNCLEFFKIYFLKIKYSHQSISFYKKLFRKKKKIRALRKKKLKNSSIYLRMIIKKEILFSNYFLIKKEIFNFLTELSKLLESYVFDIESSLKRREVYFGKYYFV
jgi:hypothetical protein